MKQVSLSRDSPLVLFLVFQTILITAACVVQLVYEACPICSQVFYVDYGNCGIANLSQIRQWDDSLDCYPLQALECKLDNIIKLKGQNENAIAFFESQVLQKSVTATIT